MQKHHLLHLLPLALLFLFPLITDAADFRIDREEYLQSGFFTNPAIPQEGQPVTLQIRAMAEGEDIPPCNAQILLQDSTGRRVSSPILPLTIKSALAEASWQWTPEKNGIYTASLILDPENAIAEDNEENNTTSLRLPVVIPDRPIHFIWYREPEGVRWATCITSTKGEQRLAERGVLPLNWEYGGMSWSYYDKERAATDPEAELADLENLFYQKFTGGDVKGFGIDECGGYPGTWKYHASIASMKALVRAKADMPDRTFAVWNGGGLRPELAALYRRAADFLLLETYVWRALPDELGVEDIYQLISDRIEPFIRSTDMFQPAYGNHCYTLLALDTSERPDRTTPGEFENIIRFIRSRFPEMRGIAWYNGGFGNSHYGLEKTPESEAQHRKVLKHADDLSYRYWVRPCVTLMRESLWIENPGNGKHELTVALSNIGGMDAHNVTVQFYINGEVAGMKKAECVPAGPNRNRNRAFLKLPVALTTGTWRFEARISAAPDATVLEPAIIIERFIP